MGGLVLGIGNAYNNGYFEGISKGVREENPNVTFPNIVNAYYQEGIPCHEFPW